MSEAGKAVFLSYASQDAEAAKRIAGALRTAGVEVWFDQSELRGGDAWDALIRKRIKECTLFVPVITPNTNARAEGYFRLEWKLAVDRSHLMADDAPFLFPVVIGDVTDASARVPDKFRDVQWTRLRLDETPGELAARVARLLSGAPTDNRQPTTNNQAGRSRPAHWQWWMVFPIIGTLMGLMFAAVPMWKAFNRPPRSSPSNIEAPAAPAKSVIATARDWPKDPELQKAMNLTEGLEAIPDDLALAEEIAKRVLDRSPTDIEAVTVMARVQSHFLRRGFDRSDERAALAKRYAERALQLAPDEPEAMYALATYHFSRVTGEEVRIEQLLRRAMELDPSNPRPGRLLADLYNATSRFAEAIAQGQDNIRRFPKDVLSHYDLARNYKDQGRYDEFDRELDATMALAPLPNAIVWKARLQFGLRNDFAGMKTWLDRVPARVRGTERAVFGYFIYAAFGGDPEAGLASLRDFPQKWFTDFEYAGPTALLNASLLELQGKKELALRQYEVAQGEIQRMRHTDPARIGLSQVEFWTLLGLGRIEEAKASHRRVVEGSRRPYLHDMVNGWWFTVLPGSLLIGDRATALTLLRESVEMRPESRAAFRLRFQIDPRMAPFRNDPEIKALLAEPVLKTEDRGQKTEVRVPIDQKSVAVLAFANLSDDKANEYFSDGISEELLNVLGRVPGLRVAAPMSAFSFKGRDVSAQEIGQKLNVAYLVSGSVRRAGSSIRVVARLSRASTAEQIWTEKFDGEAQNVFALQEEIARQIASALSLKLGASARAAKSIKPEAYKLYLEGRHFWSLRNFDAFDHAEQAFLQAEKLEPESALIHAGLAELYATRGWYRALAGRPVGEDLTLGAQQAERARQLDPGIALAYSAPATIALLQRRFPEAEWLLQQALALAPNDATIIDRMGDLMVRTGRLDGALDHYQRAAQLDPFSRFIVRDLARVQLYARRFDDCIATIDRFESTGGEDRALSVWRGGALLGLGRKEEALAVLRSVLNLVTEARVVTAHTAAEAVGYLRAAGGEAESDALGQRLMATVGADTYLPAMILIARGRFEEGINQLQEFPAGSEDRLFWSSVFDPVRDDPRFGRKLSTLPQAAEYKIARATLVRMQKEQGTKP